MYQLLFKRLSLFFPTVFFTLSLCFWLGQDAMVNHYIESIDLKNTKPSNERYLVDQFKKAYQLDLPKYYFSIGNQNAADQTLINEHPEWTNLIRNLQFKSGDHLQLANFIEYLSSKEDDNKLIGEVKSLVKISRNEEGSEQIKWYNETISTQRFVLNNHIPSFNWHGTKCQFHYWLSHALQGNFGRSIHTQGSVNSRLLSALKNTLLISIISIILIFAVGIGLAYFSFKQKRKWLSSLIDQLMYFMYSIPNFWLASILIVLLTTPQFLNWFPAYGFGESQETSFLDKAPFMILPIVCLSYGAIAIVYAHMSSAFGEEFKKQYVITARSKGLSSNQIIYRHIFKNAAFPIISLSSGIFLFILSGSFVVEHIFAIPGVGKLTIDSILMRDYPILYALVLLFSTAAFLGYLISDILYHHFDPRIKGYG